MELIAVDVDNGADIFADFREGSSILQGDIGRGGRIESKKTGLCRSCCPPLRNWLCKILVYNPHCLVRYNPQ